MNQRENGEMKKSNGVSIKIFSIWVLALLVVISALSVVSATLSITNYKVLTHISSDYSNWRTNAEDMMKSSDYLTEQVRAFVAEGDHRFMNNYFHEAYNVKRRDDAVAYMEKNFPGSDMYYALKKAMEKSVELMNTEYYAIRLKGESMGDDVSLYPQIIQDTILSEKDVALSSVDKEKKARGLLFDANYLDAKTQISDATSECLDELVIELEMQQGRAERSLRVALILELVLVIIFVVFSIFVIIVARHQIFKPLINAIPIMESDEPLPIQGAQELRHFEKTYNKLYELHQKNKSSLKFKANHDALTGILNRRAFDKLQSLNQDESLAFIMMDIDDFKNVNDQYGHIIGDKVLVRVVNLLNKHFRSIYKIYRIGGDEFAIVMYDMGPKDKKVIIEKIKSINKDLAISIDENIPAVSVSAGVSFGLVIDEALMNKADEALYSIKKVGKSGCGFAEE